MGNSVLILGCGSSGGVPLAIGEKGGFWGECDPLNPKNRRSRCSVIVTYEGQNFLIDTSPDLRSQLLAHDVPPLDCVLYTHAHADHLNGIDDLRPLYFARGKKTIPCYGEETVLSHLKNSFSYLFQKGKLEIYPKVLDPVLLSVGKNDVLGASFVTFHQEHGPQKSLGFRFGDLAYSTDFKELSCEALQALEGVKIWIVDCVAREEKPTHCHLEKSLYWDRKSKPAKSLLDPYESHSGLSDTS